MRSSATHNDDGTVDVHMRFKSEDEMHVSRAAYEHMEEWVRAIFLVAGFEVKEIFRIANQYENGMNIMYFRYLSQNPWWLVCTDFGMIVFGRRKRVWEIDWSRTSYRGKILDPEDSTTSGDDFVHCWQRDHVVRELTTLHNHLVAEHVD